MRQSKIIFRYPDGTLKAEYWYDKSIKPHRDGGPAQIEYYQNGTTSSETWYQNGKTHRDDGPAKIRYWENGEEDIYEYFLNGVNHTPVLIESKAIDEKGSIKNQVMFDYYWGLL